MVYLVLSLPYTFIKLYSRSVSFLFFFSLLRRTKRSTLLHRTRHCLLLSRLGREKQLLFLNCRGSSTQHLLIILYVKRQAASALPRKRNQAEEGTVYAKFSPDGAFAPTISLLPPPIDSEAEKKKNLIDREGEISLYFVSQRVENTHVKQRPKKQKKKKQA